MKYLSLLVLFFLSYHFGFSQVKKQYLDDKNLKSTVVVKEDNVSDMDILNSQFDINSIGLGQEIRIKTEKDPPKPIKKKVTTIKDVVTPKGNVPKKTTTKKVVRQKRMSTKAAAAMPRVKKKPTEIYYKGIGKSSNKKLKMKKRKPVKRKKLKKRKYRKGRCYRF